MFLTGLGAEYTVYYFHLGRKPDANEASKFVIFGRILIEKRARIYILTPSRAVELQKNFDRIFPDFSGLFGPDSVST